MSLKLNERYPGRFNNPSAAYPQGSFKNRTSPSAKDGSYLEKDWANDKEGFFQSLLTKAGIVPDGTIDTVISSQYYDAMRKVITDLVTTSSPVVGSTRNAKMSIPTPSASGAFTADEIVVESVLGAQTYRLASFNKAINLASVGAGGMDTGAAPASGFVSIYAIYNPTSDVSALLACNQTTSSGSVYTGANMPAGYTASALVSAWGTTAAGLLTIGLQLDRQIGIAQALIVSSTVNQTATPTSIASIVPIATKKVSGLMQVGSSASANCTISLSGSPSGIGSKNVGASVIGGNVVQGPFTDVLVGTTQTIYYTANAQSGALSSVAYVTSYSI